MDNYEEEISKLDHGSLIFELESEVIVTCAEGGGEHYDKVRLCKRELLRRLRRSFA